MAMTAVDVCNNALGQIAHDRTITSLTDGSAEAVRCALFWPRARRAVLAARPWKFLQASGTPGTAGTPLAGFTKAYARP